MLTRRAFLATATTTTAAFARRLRNKHPNVVVILTDDQGWGDLSFNGNTNLSTPNIDSLARDGAWFDRFFVCPVCAPTRAEFLTGRYHPRGGVRGVSTGLERLNLDERTIAQDFRDAGYATGAFGKWHNGSQSPYHPNDRGFAEYYGFTSGHWAHYFDTQMDHNGELVTGKGYIADDLTDHAMAFIEKHRGKPFFCYLPLNTPHSPMQVPDKYYDKFASMDPAMKATDPKQEEVGMTRAALAMVENIDWNVGRVLAKLKALQLEEDTIVLFFCDNGPQSFRWNGGMKGRKGSVDEGGVRSPLFIRWPGAIPANRKVEPIAAAIDLLPTLTALTGIAAKGAKPLDGKNLAPLLSGKATTAPDRMIFSHWNNRVSVRTQGHRLDNDGRLYDMIADPAQKRDISNEQPELAAKLRTAVAEWRREVLTQTGPDQRPFPVGHAKTTYLPARDGEFSGGVKRSNTAPNSSYFTNWKSTEDRIFWNIEVAKPAEFSVELHYTAPQAGSRIELSLNGSKLEASIAEAHDPPMFGMKEDRHHRGPESYAKDFKVLHLGKLRLNGKGALTLRALSIAGETVGEVRYLVLRRA